MNKNKFFNLLALSLLLFLIQSSFVLSEASNCNQGNFSLLSSSSTEVNCTSLNLQISNATNYVIAGKLRLINSTLILPTGANISFDFKSGSLFEMNKSKLDAASNMGVKDGRVSITFSNGSSALIDNSTINYIQQSGFLIKSNNFTLSNSTYSLSDGNIIFDSVGSSNINKLISNNSLTIKKSSYVNINNSYFTNSGNTQIEDSSNITINSTYFDNSVVTFYTIVDSTEIFLSKLSLTNLSIDLTNSDINCYDFDCNSSNMDPSSNINQYFSANYRVLRKYTAALLSNVIVEAYQNDTTLFTSGRTNSSGNVSLMLLSFNKTDSDINYFNYTVFFSKENFRSENESLNITKLNQTYYNLTVNMMTLKGIVPSGAIACANSYRYFCAESNPLSILNLKPGLKYRINFTINATGNGFAFPLDNVNSFFIFANSNILKVNQSESSRVNITIAP